MLQEAGHIKNTVVLLIRHIQCLHLMNSEVSWILVSSETQVQSQIILNPDYLPEFQTIFPFLMTMVLLNVMFLQSQGNHKFITIFAISPKNTCKGIYFYLSCSRYINCTLCKNKLLYWYIQGLCYNFRHIYFSQYLSMSESSLLHFF